MSKEIVLFKNDEGKEITLEHLFKKIYDNSTKKQENIQATAEYLKPMIQTIQDAVIIMPTFVQLQQVSVQNDEQLIKLANLVQKMHGSKKNTPIDGYIMSSEERNELLSAYKESRKPRSSGEPAGSE